MGPLDGLKVLELSKLTPAAFTTVMLGDMGAEVTRVTAPADGADPLDARFDSPAKVAANWLDRNKRWIALDLKSPRGKDIFRQLAADADVLVEGFRPGVMGRLGLDYESLQETNPRLVYCSMSAFGQDGPYRLRPAHDLDLIALAGVLGMIGPEGTVPPIPMNLIADYGGASMHAALGVMFALFARERSGRGQYVDISYLDTTFAMLSASPPVTAWLAGGESPSRRRGLFTSGYPFYSVYEDRDGQLMTISATEPWIFRNLCEAVGRPELVEGAMQADVFEAEPSEVSARVRAGLQEAFRSRTRAEWFEILGAANVCVGVVATVEDAYSDPQIRHRGMAMTVHHEDPSVGEILQPGFAIRLSDTPASVRRTAPGIAADTDSVLAELGYSNDEISDLRHDGII